MPSTESNWEYRLRDCVRSYNSSITFIFTITANYDSCSGSTIFILHPPSVADAFYAVLIIMQLNTYISYSISPQVQKIIISLVFITTCALPVVTALILLQKGYIKSLEMETLNERKIPFLSTALFYFMCYYLLHQLPVPRILGLMVMGLQ